MAADAHRAENRKLLIRLALAAVGMFGFGFALVPFYKTICEVAGLNRLVDKQDAPKNSQVDLSRTVTLEFDANTHAMPWRFRPLKNAVEVHPGQLVRVDYELENATDKPIVGQAIPSYGPQIAAQYLKKLDCFCFSQQKLAGGEKKVLPVVFVIDPALPADVRTVTLSYTFFEVEGAKAAATAAGTRG